MEFRILGPLEVRSDEGAEIALAAPRLRMVLAILLLHRNQVVSADRLVDLIWGERPPPTAATALHVAVSRLRKALPERIETKPPGYLLRVEPGELDLELFEAEWAHGRELLARGDTPDAAASAVRGALERWRGEPLADFTYEPFAEHDRERLADIRMAAAEDRFDAELAAGGHAEIVPELEAMVMEHPLRERLWGQLMLALYRAGRQADALAAYQSARRLVDELGIDPSPALQELERRMLQQDAELAAPERARHAASLPAPPHPIVGRERELHALAELIDGGARLITLTGPGGVGKTRLLLELATRRQSEHADGAWFVELAAVSDVQVAISTIGRCLGIATAGESGTLRLSEYLRPQHLLLALDNLEQLPELAPVVAQILSAALHVTVIASSRTPLHLTAEHEYPIGPLAVDAVELFEQRARASDPALTLDDDTRVVVEEICGRLDNLPLAIELAAARARLLPPAALLARLETGAGLPPSSDHDRPDRQRTLTAAINWSYRLLTAEEQRCFRRLGAFAGGFTLDAAEQVAVEPGEDAVELVGAMLDHSLVRPTGERDAAEPRFAMLETIREHAAHLLAESNEEGAIRGRHLAYIAKLCESSADGRWQWPGFVLEQANILAAFDYAQQTESWEDGLRLISPFEGWQQYLPTYAYGPVRGFIETSLAATHILPERRARAIVLLARIVFLDSTPAELARVTPLVDEAVSTLRECDGSRLADAQLIRARFATEMGTSMSRSSDWTRRWRRRNDGD